MKLGFLFLLFVPMPAYAFSANVATDGYRGLMECVRVAHPVGSILVRCENEEAVCYLSTQGGLQCQFKPGKKPTQKKPSTEN